MQRRQTPPAGVLDQDAVPTLVEVKRSTDSRIRREVVGQMLDYAANAVAYWPVENLRAQLEATCLAAGDDPAEAVGTLLGDGDRQAVERFWMQVKTNLQAGRIRLVFVADVIPPELRRVVEFLNSQMDPAEVLALEIRQFVGQRSTTLVPTVIGQTMAAQGKKSAGRETGVKWTPMAFFERLSAEHGAEVASIARDLLEWVTPLVTRVWWGEGKVDGSFVPILEVGGGRGRRGRNAHFFVVWTYGMVEMQFQSLREKPGFRDDESRLEFVRRLNERAAVRIPEDAIARRPSFPLASLTSAEERSIFKRAVAWAIDRVGSEGTSSEQSDV